jgi:hypothetical protein
MSSFVNAAYTKPKGVPDRLLAPRRIFKGICYTSEEFNEVFSLYRQKRPVFEAIINANEILSKKSKKYLLDYIGYFYKVIDSEYLIKNEILSTCETKKSYNIPE